MKTVEHINSVRLGMFLIKFSVYDMNRFINNCKGIVIDS